MSGSAPIKKLWDPFAASPRLGRPVWLGLLAWVLLFQGGDLLRSLRPTGDAGVDFFQDWVSAKNYLNRLPVYEELKHGIERYLGRKVEEDGRKLIDVCVVVNAHPPTSILMFVPFALLNYEDALFAWNVVSLIAIGLSCWLILRGLEVSPTAWSLLPLLTLLLLFSPFRKQLALGQFNALLLLLLVCLWRAERSGWEATAGLLLGVATAVKLYPGFFFVFFLLQRRWRILAWGVASFACCTLLTAALLGFDVFTIYVRDALPQVEHCRSGWTNSSLIGFWTKLFDPHTVEEKVEPLLRSPRLAQAGKMLSVLCVISVLAWMTVKARAGRERDLAFSVALAAMLLLSPITWDHYFLILLLPICLLWFDEPGSLVWTLLVLADFTILWLNPDQIHELAIPGGRQSGSADARTTLLVLSLPFYALLGLFTLLSVRLHMEIVGRQGRPNGPGDPFYLF